MKKNVKRNFELDMHNIYRRARIEANYNATRYLQMLDNHGGLETAHILINAPQVSEGYSALWERGRLDLTVEALIWDNPEYHQLFTKEEMQKIKERLLSYKYVAEK